MPGVAPGYGYATSAPMGAAVSYYGGGVPPATGGYAAYGGTAATGGAPQGSRRLTYDQI